MALALVLASLTGVPAVLHEHYKAQEDGTFMLEGIPYNQNGRMIAIENVAGLKTALSTERQQREAAQTSLKLFEGIDPVKAKDALGKVAEIANWKPDQKVEELLTQRVGVVEAKFKADLSTKDTELKEATSQLEQTLVVAAATKEIADRKGIPELLLPTVRQQTRMKKSGKGYIVEVLDAEGNTRLSPKSGATSNMTLGELIDEMKGNNIYGRAFEASGASGSGAAGGGKTGATGGGGKIREISKSDTAELNRSRKEIAAGTAVVVD